MSAFAAAAAPQNGAQEARGVEGAEAARSVEVTPRDAEAHVSEESDDDGSALPRPPVALPVPAALAGVKSKRRAVLALDFSASGAALAAAGLPAAAAAAAGGALSLGLGARASLLGLAVAEAAALCRALAVGAAEGGGVAVAYRHEGLRVAAVQGDSAEEVEAELAAARDAAPHLLAVCLRSLAAHRAAVCPALRGFRGALLILEAAGDGDAAALLRPLGVSSRWRAGPCGVDAAKLPPAPATEIFGDIRVRDLEQDPALATLARAAQPLYEEHFHEDLLDDLRSKDTARVAFLVRPSSSGGAPTFCGVLVYKLWGPPLRVMSILRVAVPPPMRMFGYGKLLTRWVLQRASLMPRTQCTKLTLCAKPDAIAFYERLGWTRIPEERLALSADGEGARRMTGAIWMEMPCGKPAPKR